jgi:hypothetical protein
MNEGVRGTTHMWGRASALQAMCQRDRASLNESVRGITHMWGRASALQAMHERDRASMNESGRDTDHMWPLPDYAWIPDPGAPSRPARLELATGHAEARP